VQKVQKVQLTKNLISRETALLIDPIYVAYVEGDFSKFEAVMSRFEQLKVRQQVITYHNGKYVACTISSINHNDIRAVDGPVVRLTNGEYSWRVDGNGYAAPV